MLQQKCFGGIGSDDVPYGVLKDNSLYFVGYTLSQNSGDITDSICIENNAVGAQDGDIWYLKTDMSLNIISEKIIGGNRYESIPDLLNSVCTNNQYLVTHSNSDSSCNKTAKPINPIGGDDVWIIEIDTLGQIINDKNYGGNESDYWPNSVEFIDSSMIVLSTSNVYGGGNQTAVGYGNSDMWAFKLDKNKNVVWDKAFGGTLRETGGTGFTTLLVKVSESKFAFVCAIGGNATGNITLPSIGAADIWFVCCDTTGNILFQKRFGGLGSDAPIRIISTNDKGFLILGFTESQVGFDVSLPPIGSAIAARNIWLLKLDSLGNKQWDNRHGGSSYADWPQWVEEAPDGGYWIASNMDTSTPNSNISEPGYGFDDVWMLKVDSLGNKVWDKRFGSAGNDRVRNFMILPDSSIIICAYADSGISGNKTVAGNGGSDFWLIHFKYTDTTSTVGLIDPKAFDESISLYPNPASDVVTIASNKTQIQNVTMYNLLGELIETKNYTSSHTIQFDLQTYPKGVYIAKITGQQSTVARKVVKN